MPKKNRKPYRRPVVEIDWEVFLDDPSSVDALIDFIEGNTNNRELLSACRDKTCKPEIDRMRRLGNYESRDRARKFLSQYYTWE